MNNHFLHVGFNWSGPSKLDELEPVFNKAKDWLRYAPNCWILWTGLTPQVWYTRLKPFVGKDDRLFICKLDTTVRQGWLEPWIWDWLKKAR